LRAGRGGGTRARGRGRARGAARRQRLRVGEPAVLDGAQLDAELRVEEGAVDVRAPLLRGREPLAVHCVAVVLESELGALLLEFREIDQRIDSMGPVNLDAIQEFDELEQRYTFLEQQNTDLTNAKAELIDVIAKINQTTQTLFAETFEKVRVNFAEMFVELFGGGKANLLLLDEADPLECGIDIIAKPPGKQLQSISLLSGGERTMTAVALLFSIYMVKPAPFCVLDEVDAPFDEANIGRFVNVLNEFLDSTKFIIVTHSKKTMTAADVIYGITMQESGVSRQVSVKFEEVDDRGQIALSENKAA
jgi:chromosome segregation protein